MTSTEYGILIIVLVLMFGVIMTAIVGIIIHRKVPDDEDGTSLVFTPRKKYTPPPRSPQMSSRANQDRLQRLANLRRNTKA
jgi:hypothetical protein